jgi:hypothetical protein
VQVEEGSTVATVVEESGMPPPPVTVAVEEGWTTVETAAPQAALEPPAGAGSGGADMVMVPSDEDSAPPPLARDRDVVMSTVLKPSPATGVVSVEEAMDLATRRYVDFPGIGTIDLDAPELPNNDQEMLDVATERMFAELSILETIMSVTLALRQYDGAGGSAPPAMLEVVEAVPKESAAGAESAAVMSALSPTREDQGASLPQPTEAVASTPVAAVTDVAEGVVGEAGPSSPRPVAATAEEVLVPSEPAVAPQVRMAPEGTTRVASPKTQEAEEDTGATLLQGATSGEAQTLELACTPWAATSESGDDAEDDEEVATCNTLERELNWARRGFDELILAATSVSFFA